MDPRRDTRWWGWGDPGESGSLNEASEAMLNEREILPESAPVLPALGDVKVPPAQPLPDSIADLVGGTNVFTDDEDRIRHSGGQSYLDLLERRSGVIDAAPDAVVLPADAGQIGPLLDICAGAGIAVVPFGGGTSVVGGIAPIRGDHDLVISLDLVNLRACDIDPVSRTARLGAGLRGPEAEKLLGAEGFTLGHYPQSFEYATIGGFAATRSAGQSSSGYGRFDSMVSSVRLIAPTGELSTLDTPHTAIGPALREMVIGSEGIFGVIPDVDVRIRPAPATRRYEAWIAEDFRSGNEIMRDLAQAGLLPTIARVSDDAETRVSLASAVPSGMAGSAFKGYLRLRGRSSGSLVILGIEGTSDHVRRTRPELARRLRKGGAVYLGQGAGNGWSKGRFHGPYLRETLLDRGVLVETFETATQWSHHDELYNGVREATEAAMASVGMKGIVMCHLSHVYADGGSLYFTVISSPGDGGGAASWPVVKAAALDAMQAHGATLSHHHATGRDHAPWVGGEIGDAGVSVLEAVKDRLDPNGIMNPGKLLPLRQRLR